MLLHSIKGRCSWGCGGDHGPECWEASLPLPFAQSQKLQSRLEWFLDQCWWLWPNSLPLQMKTDERAIEVYNITTTKYKHGEHRNKQFYLLVPGWHCEIQLDPERTWWSNSWRDNSGLTARAPNSEEERKLIIHTLSVKVRVALEPKCRLGPLGMSFRCSLYLCHSSIHHLQRAVTVASTQHTLTVS